MRSSCRWPQEDASGRTEILSPIGAGGMGEVYRASDTRLARTVAIKVIRSQSTVSPEFQDRFAREARAISALDHPHICALYDVGHDDGLDYLVIQYLEGETLAERLGRLPQPLPLDETLRHARQIAEALGAAHRKNIVHRDLKPGNVMLTKSGIKLLDFGLAKLVARAPAGEVASIATLTSPPVTGEGKILGTLLYMSPEQLEGRDVDGRSDVFSFGAVLFEMLTGRRLFERESQAAVIAAVMTVDPASAGLLSGVKPALPAKTRRDLERLLRKCLAKHPDDRWQSAADLAYELTGIEEDWRGGTDETKAPLAPSRGWPAWMVVAAGLAGAGAAALGLSLFGRSIDRKEAAPELQAIRFMADPPAQTSFANLYDSVAPSPDGRFVVFSARPETTDAAGLWLRPLDSSSDRLLQGTDADPDSNSALFPTWSPDSRSIAFFAEGKLKRIEIVGGAPLTLCDASIGVAPGGATWNRSAIILFGGAAGLHRVSASGGTPELVTTVDRSRRETGHGFPQFMPDGNRFLYFVASDNADVQGVYASALDKPGEPTQVLRTAAKAVYVPPRATRPAYLLWMRDQTLLAQRIDEDSLQLQGDPSAVAEDVSVNIYNSRPAFSVSDGGLLTYFSGSTFTKRPLVWVNRDGKQETAAPDDTYWNLALAPGAKRMAFSKWGTTSAGLPNLDVWVKEFGQSVASRLTTDPARDGAPAWAPDGKQVAFASARDGGVAQIYRMHASGAGEPVRLTDGRNYKVVQDWSPDGRFIVYTELGDLMAVPSEGGTPLSVVDRRSGRMLAPSPQMDDGLRLAQTTPAGSRCTSKPSFRETRRRRIAGRFLLTGH